MLALGLAGKASAKARGLLGIGTYDGALLLMPCRDIHTAGMSRPIDVAFLDASGRVLEAHRNVMPFRRMRCSRAVAVVERFSSCETPWFSAGERVGIARVGDGV